MKKILLIIMSAVLAASVGVGGMLVIFNMSHSSRGNSLEFYDANDDFAFIEVGTTVSASGAKLTSSDPTIISVTRRGELEAHKCGVVQITSASGDVFTAYAYESSIGDNLPTSNISIVSTDNAEYTYEQMTTDIKKICKAYPYIAEYTSIGKTYDGREIYDVAVGNPSAEKQILIQACMHSREYLNALLVMRQIESICAGFFTASYDSRPYCELFTGVCIHFIPMVNPDGVTISQLGVDGIRDDNLRRSLLKMYESEGGSDYFRHWKANARGVDLNRNYPVNWDKYTTGATTAGNKNYKGSAPASERETQCLMAWIKANKPCAIINYHSTGSVLYWNFLQEGELQNKCESLFDMVHGLTGYRDAEPDLTKDNQTWEPTFGAWTCSEEQIPTITIETGTGECPLKIDEFTAIWSNQKHMPAAIALWATDEN